MRIIRTCSNWARAPHGRSWWWCALVRPMTFMKVMGRTTPPMRGAAERGSGARGAGRREQRSTERPARETRAANCPQVTPAGGVEESTVLTWGASLAPLHYPGATTPTLLHHFTLRSPCASPSPFGGLDPPLPISPRLLYTAHGTPTTKTVDISQHIHFSLKVVVARCQSKFLSRVDYVSTLPGAFSALSAAASERRRNRCRYSFVCVTSML